MKTLGKPPAMSHEAQLQRELGKMVREIRATLQNVDTPAKAKALGRALRQRWSDARIKKIVEKLGKRAEEEASKPWKPLEPITLIKDAKDARRPYQAEKLVLNWVKDATKLITSVRDEVAAQLEKDIVEALEKGQSPKDLQRKWIRNGIPLKFGTLQGRVKVIAQHQMSMLHAQVQRERAKAVGVTKFVWRTQEDGRVRSAHRALNGKEFSYDKPPAEGLPGQPINCRCFAESVIPDEMLSEVAIARKL